MIQRHKILSWLQLIFLILIGIKAWLIMKRIRFTIFTNSITLKKWCTLGTPWSILMNLENVMKLYQYAWRMIGLPKYAKLTHGFKNVTICCSTWSLEDFHTYQPPTNLLLNYSYQVFQNSCPSQSLRMVNTTQVISFKISKLTGLIHTLSLK